MKNNNDKIHLLAEGYQNKKYTKLYYELFVLRGKYEVDGKIINIKTEEIVLLSIIYSLSTAKENTPCTASNIYLAKLMNVPVNTLRNYSRNLNEAGFIKKKEVKIGCHTENRTIYIQWDRINNIINNIPIIDYETPGEVVEIPCSDLDTVIDDPVQINEEPCPELDVTLPKLEHDPVQSWTANTIKYNNNTIDILYNAFSPNEEENILSDNEIEEDVPDIDIDPLIGNNYKEDLLDIDISALGGEEENIYDEIIVDESDLEVFNNKFGSQYSENEAVELLDDLRNRINFKGGFRVYNFQFGKMLNRISLFGEQGQPFDIHAYLKQSNLKILSDINKCAGIM